MIMGRLEFLKGETLQTLAQGKKFDILNVDYKGIDILVHSTNRERYITKIEIEKSWEILISNESLLGTYILNEVPSRSSAYIAAMLAQLPEVSYSLRPIELTYINNLPIL